MYRADPVTFVTPGGRQQSFLREEQQQITPERLCGLNKSVKSLTGFDFGVCDSTEYIMHTKYFVV